MRAQVALLQRQTQRRGWGAVEALTVDKFQGRDKDAILISLVRAKLGAQCRNVLHGILACWFVLTLQRSLSGRAGRLHHAIVTQLSL